MGSDRYKTSIETAKTVDSNKAVLASGKNSPDSISSSNLSNKGYKLILIDKNTDIKAILKNIDEAVIVGGQSEISKDIEDKIKGTVPKVKRIAGLNRYETNLKTIEYVGYTDVGIADGENYPDALAATGLLKEKNMGIMLVDGSDKYTVYNSSS